jgi:hypothetical protein
MHTTQNWAKERMSTKIDRQNPGHVPDMQADLQRTPAASSQPRAAAKHRSVNCWVSDPIPLVCPCAPLHLATLPTAPGASESCFSGGSCERSKQYAFLSAALMSVSSPSSWRTAKTLLILFMAAKWGPDVLTCVPNRTECILLVSVTPACSYPGRWHSWANSWMGHCKYPPPPQKKSPATATVPARGGIDGHNNDPLHGRYASKVPPPAGSIQVLRTLNPKS